MHVCWVGQSRPVFVTPGTVTHQAPLSMGFLRQEYWSGLPFPSPGDLPDPGTKPTSPTLAGRFFTTEPPGKSHLYITDKEELNSHHQAKKEARDGLAEGSLTNRAPSPWEFNDLSGKVT